MKMNKLRKLAGAYKDPQKAYEIIVDSIPTLRSIHGFVKTERAAQEDFRGRVTLSGLRSRLYLYSKEYDRARGRSGTCAYTCFSDMGQLRANRQYHGGDYSG